MQVDLPDALVKFWNWFREWPLEWVGGTVVLLMVCGNWAMADEVAGQWFADGASKATFQRRVMYAVLAAAAVYTAASVLRGYKARTVRSLEENVDRLNDELAQERAARQTDLVNLREVKDYEIAGIRQQVDEHEQRQETLNAERETLLQDIQSLCLGYLVHMARGALDFGTVAGTAERVTLYVFDSTQEAFVPIGRFSDSPGFSKKGREFYPVQEGCIALAWQDSWHFSNDYPDPREDPEGYSAASARRKLSPAVVEGMNMKSRLYCGHRIMDSEGSHPLAVIVVESTAPERWIEKQLKTAIKNDSERKYLTDLVQRIGPRIPQPSVAQAAGF